MGDGLTLLHVLKPCIYCMWLMGIHGRVGLNPGWTMVVCTHTEVFFHERHSQGIHQPPFEGTV